jgi:hypothetical protein
MSDSLDIIYDNLGMDLENAIRTKILSGVPPPNAPSTIHAKGSSHTLIDTGTLLDTVSHTVEINPELIKITAGILDEGEIAEIACYNEYGTLHIPERSFIRSTFDEIFDSQIMEKFSDEMLEFSKVKLGK